jgi:hypothetical protein
VVAESKQQQFMVVMKKGDNGGGVGGYKGRQTHSPIEQ